MIQRKEHARVITETKWTAVPNYYLSTLIHVTICLLREEVISSRLFLIDLSPIPTTGHPGMLLGVCLSR